VFEIPGELMEVFYQREEEFRFVWVEPENLDGSPMHVRGLVCARYSDEEYLCSLYLYLCDNPIDIELKD
jgi:hypothetical protein